MALHDMSFKLFIKVFFERARCAKNNILSSSIALSLVWILIWVLSFNTAHAVVAENLTIGSAKALSLGHAVTADPPGIDSIHFNPAGLARIKGRKAHVKVVSGIFSVTLDIGDDVPERTQFVEDWRANTNLPDSVFVDPVRNTRSETKGASLMLPFFGMTDLPVSLAPIGGATYSPPQSRFTIGTNVYMPLGVGFYRDEDDPGRYMGERIGFSVMTYFSPSVAYQVTDSLSVGAALTFNYVAVGLDLAFRGPYSLLKILDDMQFDCGKEDNFLGFDNVVDICGGSLGLYNDFGYLSFEVEKGLSFGMNVGFLWQPVPWFTLGMVYQAPIEMDMSGPYRWRNSDLWQNFIVPLSQSPNYKLGEQILGAIGLALPTGAQYSSGEAKLEMEYPEHYSVGVSVQVLPRLKVNMDYKYTGWSSWQSIPVHFENVIDFMLLAEYLQPDGATRTSVNFPLGMDDTWNWGVGFEYKYNDRLKLRLGIEDRPTSIPKASRSPLLPIDSGKLYAVGFDYQMESGSHLEFSVGMLKANVNMPGGTSRLGNSLDPSLVIYNPYAGTDVEANLNALVFALSFDREF